MRRHRSRRIVTLAAIGLAVAVTAHAGDEALLPADREVAAVLARTPAWRAARQAIETEREARRQAVVGPQEWIGSVNLAQRRIRDSAQGNTLEWEAGLDRTLRRPGKRDAADRLGGSRVELAQAMGSLAWREQARALIERYGAWLREREAARAWREQVALLEAQAGAVAKRQRLGDAARIEQVQVDAALAQAQAQVVIAEGRAQAAREALGQQFPGLAFPQPPSLPGPPELPAHEGAWIDAQLAHAPELESARRALQVAEEQLRVEQLERRPDPTVGLRLGQARDASEQVVGVVLSIPFGGEYRAAACAPRRRGRPRRRCSATTRSAASRPRRGSGCAKRSSLRAAGSARASRRTSSNRPRRGSREATSWGRGRWPICWRRAGSPTSSGWRRRHRQSTPGLRAGSCCSRRGGWGRSGTLQ
ncbi:MAG: hypothetical protein U1F17_07935 [Burkholderiaceae bacterium]